MNALEAINLSIREDRIVTIDWSEESMAYLKSRSGYYTVVSAGFQFDGGDESARNDWTVVVKERK